MKAFLVGTLLIFSADVAIAQQLPSLPSPYFPGYLTPNASEQRNFQSGPALSGPSRLPATAEQRALRLARAKKVRVKYEQLLANDGGELTAAHRAYITRQVREVLALPS